MKYIGIDCGVHTGFAVWEPDGGYFTAIETLPIHRALDRAAAIARGGEALTIIFEDARQRRWIPRETSESDYRGKLMGAGSVKRDAVIWEDFCKDYKIPYEAVPPSKGLTKWDADYFARVTGWMGRTSNHARDAALLVWGKR